MRHKALITLAVASLLVTVWFTQGHGHLTVAGPLEPQDSTGVGNVLTPAQETCNSCADCSTKLASGSYVTVTLTMDLLNVGGGCVSVYLGESDVVFDCDGHTIDGTGPVVDSAGGIVMMHGSNNTIMNCTVSDFDYGIYLADATNHTVANNTTSSNGVGIRLGSSNSNDVHDNTSTDSFTGISLENSDSNTLNSNIVCNNSTTDFNVDATSNGNTGDNNTCDLPDGWDDTGTTGCTSICAGTTTCNSCADCTNKLDGSIFNKVLLTTDINNFAGTCVTFSADNLEFNCDGHTIDGDDSGTDYGVYIPSSLGNQVKNCTIRDFYRGIGLNSASDATISWNTVEENTYDGIYLSGSSDNNTISFNDIGSNGQYGIALVSSSGNDVHFNDLLCNDYGVRLNGSDSNTISFNDICSRPGPDFDLLGGSTGNSGLSNHCDAPNGWNDDGATGCTYLCNSLRCSTCSDGLQSGDEEGVDCGGSYCPPCAQCSGEPATQWAPHDTPCNNKWPTSDGPNIGMNTTSDSCNLVEVCDPGLDFIIEDALACCEHEDYASQLTGPRLSGKLAACNYAQNVAYDGSFTTFNPSRLKTCTAQYIISSFGGAAVYMQGYMHGEWCCYGSGSLCPSACSHWQVDPAAWEMGTPASCAGPDGETPDFQMGGHRCQYRRWWLFGWHYYGEHGYWHDDFDYHSNSDSAVDTPTHASINRLSTGTCVDYSFAVTTLLRKAGYSPDDVWSVNGEGHGYNLLRFPGESKWHYVDTVGNRGGEVFGGPEWPHPLLAWYDYCHNLDDGCSNDVHSQSRSHCPSNDAIFGCETVVRSRSASTPPAPTVQPDPSPGCLSPQDSDEVNQACTELNPCTEEHTADSEPPGPMYNIEVGKTASSDEIVLGESLEVQIVITNTETKSIDVLVEETFIPGVTYSLEPQERSYESFTFQYHDWSLQLAPTSTQMVTFTAVPSDVGYYSFIPTSVYTGGNSYRSSSAIVKVVCNPNGTCDPGETNIFCPNDCSTGIEDDYCDMAWDGINDPDCAGGVDPDFDPAEDTDGDGVLDGSDECPLTPDGGIVDAAGCTCEQKVCADEDPLTVNQCNPTTAACEYVADTDGDQVSDSEDNCPADYNPEQYDTDTDGTGDQCEIGPVDADTTLDGGTYYIYDYDLDGAVTITASNVTLDCNGATILGNGSGYGIYVPDHIVTATIQNCTVRGYRYGIYVDSSSGNKVLSNTLETNAFGIILGSSSGNTLSSNTAVSNTQSGVYLEGSTGNQVSNNAMNLNGGLGIFVHTSSNNDFSGNTVCGNTDSDFAVYTSTNTGNDNTCDNPDDWSDEGMAGCSYACGYQRIYLPVVLRNY
ncbi:MAG: NosD domain-containing protein [Chloroflexota bacterium]|nr:NosD domain-containing protein [Chloroflexota bacterium]